MYGRGVLINGIYGRVSGLYTTIFTLIKDLIDNCGLLTYGKGVVADVISDEVNGYDWSFDGTTLQISAIYPELVTADTNNIIYDIGGNPIPLTWATVANITGNQLIINKDEISVSFYENALPVGSDCLQKALRFQDLNEPFQVQTEEGSGVFENFIVDGDVFYVIKEGVTVE